MHSNASPIVEVLFNLKKFFIWFGLNSRPSHVVLRSKTLFKLYTFKIYKFKS